MEFANLLTIIIFLPLVGSLLMLFAPSDRSIRWFALVVTFATFLLSLPLWFGFDVVNAAELQFRGVEFSLISESLDVRYLVGIDGFSLLLVLLTTFLGPIIVLCSWNYITENTKAYYILLLILQTGMTGVFCAFDILLFYIFFELTLIPMYFLIGIWGGERRIYAALKFVIYTMAGSILMLIAIIYLGYAAGHAINDGMFSTNYFKLLTFDVPFGMQSWLFVLFAFAFAIKVPLFPFHTWLPDAHVQAPTGGSVVLAGILLKMGTYGLVRFCLPLFPSASASHTLLIGIFAVIGIVYGALVSRAQSDAKKLVAYSSVSHLGFVVLGIFALTLESLQGAMIQMINHGISTGALFLILGMLYERRHTRMMDDYGGIARSVPWLTFFMVLTVLASAGLPGLNGFVGEFLILVGAFSSDVTGMQTLSVIATTGVILAAVYLLWMLSRMFFGPLTQEANRAMSDLNMRELVILVPMALLMILLGLMPQPFLKVSEPAAENLLQIIEHKRAVVERDDPSLERIFEFDQRPSPSATSEAPPAILEP